MSEYVIVIAAVVLLITGCVVWLLGAFFAAVGLVRLAVRAVRHLTGPAAEASCPRCRQPVDGCTCVNPQLPRPRPVARGGAW